MRVNFLAAIFGLLVSVLSVNFASAQRLLDVRIGAQGDQTRAIIELDEGLEYRIFSLASPPRIVVDFTGLSTGGNFSPTTSSFGLVRDVRIGQFNESVTRVVLDLNSSGRLADSFFLSPQGGSSFRLVMDLAAGNPAPDGITVGQGNGSPTNPSNSNDQTNQGAGNSNSTSTPIASGDDVVQLPLERPASMAGRARFIIVLDPGHGGRDPGAVSSSGLEESGLVLDMAREISRELRRDDAYEVYLTRGTDRLVPLSERAELARGIGADFFISIHANANPDPDFRGFMVFTLSDNASDRYSQEVAERENQASELGAVADISDDRVREILEEMLRRNSLNQAIDFGARLVEALTGEVRLTNSPQRRAGFVVLKSVSMPSALIEIGHLTNRSEANALQTRSHRRKIASAVRQALDEHFANN